MHEDATIVPPGNTYLTAVDWATGTVLDRQFVAAAPGLELREPEGMAVSVRNGVPHLHFGLVSFWNGHSDAGVDVPCQFGCVPGSV